MVWGGVTGPNFPPFLVVVWGAHYSYVPSLPPGSTCSWRGSAKSDAVPPAPPALGPSEAALVPAGSSSACMREGRCSATISAALPAGQHCMHEGGRAAAAPLSLSPYCQYCLTVIRAVVNIGAAILRPGGPMVTEAQLRVPTTVPSLHTGCTWAPVPEPTVPSSLLQPSDVLISWSTVHADWRDWQ